MTRNRSAPASTPTDGTRTSRQHDSEPRLPHEHDESADSQRDQAPANAPLGEQAHDDVQRGLVDTDRGPAADRVYQQVRRGTPAKKRSR